MADVLIIDDDKLLCESMSIIIERSGHTAKSTNALKVGLKILRNNSFDVVFLDVHMPDGDGLRALPAVRDSPSSPEVIIITGFGDPEGAELAIKNGAWDYIEKTSSRKQVAFALSRALQYRETRRVKKPKTALIREGIIGESSSLKSCFDQLAQAASTDSNVLITGETGTGKELFAAAVHSNSTRASQPFVIVDCAALPDSLAGSVLFGHEKGSYTGADRSRTGLISKANHGTLFLDEIGELQLDLQKAFLRVIETHHFLPIGGQHEIFSDFKLVAATNRDIDKMSEEGLFRKDLLFRLKALAITLPPLRGRPGDIKEISIYHMNKICDRYGRATKGFSPEFFAMLEEYQWPGNARELVHTLEMAYASAQDDPILMPYHLPLQIRIQIKKKSIKSRNGATTATGAKPESQPELSKWRDYKREMERRYLHELMAESGGDIPKACQVSELSRPHLYSLLKKHNMNRSR